jgi:OmpA family
MKIKFVLILLSLLCTISNNAQTGTLRRCIYFETGGDKLTAQSEIILNEILDSLSGYKSYKFIIKSNTDDVGDIEFNRNLSQRRADNTTDYFVKKGIDKPLFSSTALGESEPVAENNSEEGKQKNRRVDILVRFEKKLIEPEFLPNISELYEKMSIPFQEFCVNPYRDTTIICKGGTKVFMPANSFKPSSKTANDCVNLKVKEVLDRSEMILEDLSTTSNNRIIETGGMFYTEAVDGNGNKLKLIDDKSLVFSVPTKQLNPEMKIFRGDRDTHSTEINWILNNKSSLNTMDLTDKLFCLDVNNRTDGNKCERWKFMRRVGRVGRVALGIFNSDIRTDNRDFRSCQRKLKAQRKMKGKVSRMPVINSGNTRMGQAINKRNSLENELYPCQVLDSLFNAFGVDNLDDFYRALYKPLMDSLGLSTISELQVKLEEMAKEKVEKDFANGQSNFDDLSYYVFNQPRLGWANCDAFSNFPPENMISMNFNLPAKENVDCKVVFVKRNIILPCDISGGKFERKNVPVNQEIYIVALQYVEGKPLLCLEHTTTAAKTYDLVFKELSLDELKTELSKLDNL